ncbi:hypothetical protein BT67DRAFT_452101 [Trichocladium antarcticum]|uniref:RNA polymerase II assembly factor Rtp1 C-terminal domain-containing protein n=1 Tax=Trichocladium antarcticum TaxID=1450529 RepID=A0AAN6UD85_9PEZI|nr:hypothetical protein BT67DRAFT_452101 [Trichocladium antarcticum]
MERLTLVPLRPDGVRATLEFVFSVHPSSTVKVSEAAVPQKRGANITHEALTIAGNLVSAPPASVAPETWYAAISPQLLLLLDGAEGPELVKAASYIIGFGILGRKASGAPGTAGWKFLAEPMLTPIKPPPDFADEIDNESAEIIDLRKERVLVRHDDLATAIRRLRSLVVSHPNPGLCKRMLSPLLLPLWALASWPDTQPSVGERLCTPALELLKIYLRLVPSSDLILLLVRNLGYAGGYDRSRPEWVFEATEPAKVEIVDARHSMGDTGASASLVTLEDIDRKTPKLLDLVTSTLSDADISTAFLELLRNWLKSARNSKGGGIVVTEQGDEQDPVSQMAEMKLLQAMMERFPEKLATQPKHILDLVSQILASSADSTDGDDSEIIGVALSLLNMVITVPGFQKARVDPEVLARIESSLDKLSQAPTDLSQTANNLRLLLLYRDEIEPNPTSSSSSTTTAPTSRQIEDRKTYSLAITYITQPDSPPPVRSEGLALIANLITAESPVLDIPGILVLLSSLIADADEYIYLRIIHLYTLLANRHPRAVATELLDHFADPRETHPQADVRLRFGEALLQVVQRMGETFAGELARRVGDALLGVAGRRGRRAKTEARQARDARAQARRDREAAEVWGGEVPDLSEPVAGGGEEEEEARRNESNVAGLGAGVVAAGVDLCVAVLQLEGGVEKGILRRAAVMFVMSFVRALEEARRAGRRLGFGFGCEAQEDVMRTLRYVAETDNDGLVVRHARDVVESLENWQVVKLLPAESSGDGRQELGGGLSRLAGLEVDLERAALGQGEDRPRPRIEEIE